MLMNERQTMKACIRQFVYMRIRMKHAVEHMRNSVCNPSYGTIVNFASPPFG